MRREVIGFALYAMLFALCAPATAQQPGRVPRIGVLSPFSLDTNLISPRAFRQGLREFGWIDGKNLSLEYRYAEGQNDRLPELAADLVRNKVDVIVAGPDNHAAIAATGATSTIPIIMVGVVDPVGIGLVTSLARSGRNVSGLAWEVTREQAGKNLELLKEAVPKLSRVAILRKPDDLTHLAYSKEAQRAAKILAITLRFAEVQARNDNGLKHALNSVVNEHANGLLVTPDSFFTDRRQQIVDFATRQKLPAIYFAVGFVYVGGLMSYGPDQEYMWQRAATYVDKILKGAKPADLPVEQPKKFEFVVNLKTAKQIGLTIPPNVLARADRVIR